MKDKVFEMYQNILIGKNDICKMCHIERNMEIPLSIYFVGEQFEKGEDTIMFVGKTDVGEEQIEEESKVDILSDLFIDATTFGEKNLDLIEPYATKHNFYNYTYYIIENYYGNYNKGKRFVSFTNMVKCNHSSTHGKITQNEKEFCVNKLGVIWKEIEILSPKRIVFYTNTDFDNYIDTYRPVNFIRYEDLEDKKIDMGNKTMHWWHRCFFDKNDHRILDFLRIGHPESKLKSDYVNSVVEWLRKTK